jgi:hypothetical protein
MPNKLFDETLDDRFSVMRDEQNDWWIVTVRADVPMVVNVQVVAHSAEEAEEKARDKVLGLHSYTLDWDFDANELHNLLVTNVRREEDPD